MPRSAAPRAASASSAGNAAQAELGRERSNIARSAAGSFEVLLAGRRVADDSVRALRDVARPVAAHVGLHRAERVALDVRRPGATRCASCPAGSASRALPSSSRVAMRTREAAAPAREQPGRAVGLGLERLHRRLARVPGRAGVGREARAVQELRSRRPAVRRRRAARSRRTSSAGRSSRCRSCCGTGRRPCRAGCRSTPSPRGRPAAARARPVRRSRRRRRSRAPRPTRRARACRGRTA